MSRLDFTRFICLFGIAGFWFIAVIPCIAQDDMGSLSGRVLDMADEPIAGFTIALSPVVIEDSGSMHRPMRPPHPGFLTEKTDENGAFTFTEIKPGPLQFLIPPQQFNFQGDDEIVSTKIGGMTLYLDRHVPFGSVTFGLQPGSDVENVEVTVRPRMRIRARVVFKDGTPLANASISREIKSEDVDGRGEGHSSGGATTDAEGYFMHYIHRHNDPAFYTVFVRYEGLSAKSEEFLMEPGARYDDLVLTLDSQVTPNAETSPESVKLARPPIPTKSATPKPRVPVRPLRFPDNKTAWVVNPENGHAYAKIRCRSLQEARDRAATEGAYLVAINDEAEQRWLSAFFGNYLYWIGLSNAEAEETWVWHTGEPMTYTNWGPENRFFRSIFSAKEKKGVLMTFVDGEWHAVGPGDLFWDKTGMAILEKADVFDGSSTKEK